MPSQRKLTASQQALLEEHVEETFRNIDRDYNKRTDPASAIPTVDVLLSERLSSLLELILAIPTVHPTAYLQVAYLLRFTATAREWIAGYPLTWPTEYAREVQAGHDLSDEEQAQQTVSLLLAFLQSLDRGWRKVLESKEPASGAAYEPPGEALPPTISANRVSLTMTERVRLRSSILSLRQTLIKWIERYRRRRRGGRPSDATSAQIVQNSQSNQVFSSANDSDAEMSAGYVDAAVGEDGSRGDASAWLEEEVGVGDWEIAIANSMSGTLQLIL
ncbi:hypothetical protein QFC21_003732 [Naganishia friedmannii]|uniref:Uncharacterized protein n=1 Tax=Naganishia friedmannii TaxID=89922 RepID=A0ACC2VN15_9TREE|nr:hypothetical protein QFC21_003732 [Naganishia friedmannii]